MNVLYDYQYNGKLDDFTFSLDRIFCDLHGPMKFNQNVNHNEI